MNSKIKGGKKVINQNDFTKALKVNNDFTTTHIELLLAWPSPIFSLNRFDLHPAMSTEFIAVSELTTLSAIYCCWYLINGDLFHV